MSVRASGLLLAALTLSGCGAPAKKPSAADITAYLAQSEPSYLRVGGVNPTFEAMTMLGGSKLPDGSWRVHVPFTLHAGEDLFAPTPDARTLRAGFNQAVMATEGFRVARIAAVEQLAQKAGLMKPGDAAPEPAMPVQVVTHANQDRADSVTLLAQPDGAGWKFVQLDAQALSDDAVGAPLAELRKSSPRTAFVVSGSDEDRAAQERSRRFLAILAKAPKP